MSTKTGLLNKLIVYNGVVQVGIGYVIIDEKGRVHAPNLFSNDGKELPSQWYNLMVTGEQELVVLTRRKQ